MHARRIKTSGSPDQVERAREVIEGTVIPGARAVPGFEGGYWLIDRASGQGVSVIFYDTEENLRAGSERAGELRTSATQQIGATVQGVDEFAVILDTGQKVHTGATHARYAEFAPGPGRAEEITRNLEENVLPNARRLPGFVGGLWAVDVAKGEGFGLTLFDSADSLAASRDVVRAVAQRSQEIMGGEAPAFTEYEILTRAETPSHAGV